MPDVFISSVIRGFGEFREAAKRAAEAMGHVAITSENLPAQAHSSEIACLDLASRCDIYVLVMAAEYGFQTDEGISVTHAEFRAAKATNRPILAFVQDCDKEDRQREFLQEVEHYTDGVFRKRFSSPTDLALALTESLRAFDLQSRALSEEELNDRLAPAIASVCDSWNSEPELIVAHLPEPERMTNLDEIENSADATFATLCESRLAHLREGYELRKEATWTGVASGHLQIALFSNGLTIGVARPVTAENGHFAQFFVSPRVVEQTAKGLRAVFGSTSGHVLLTLRSMGSAFFADHPYGNSVSMRVGAEPSAMAFGRLFTPLTQGTYDDWVNHCLAQLRRAFAYPDR